MTVEGQDDPVWEDLLHLDATPRGLTLASLATIEDDETLGRIGIEEVDSEQEAG